MMNKDRNIDGFAGFELADELIERGENTNAFEFITRVQMLRLIEQFNAEHSEPLLVA